MCRSVADTVVREGAENCGYLLRRRRTFTRHWAASRGYGLWDFSPPRFIPTVGEPTRLVTGLQQSGRSASMLRNAPPAAIRAERIGASRVRLPDAAIAPELTCKRSE